MFLQKAAIGYGDEGLGMYAEVVKVLHVHGIKSVVCLHFREYNKGEGMEIRTHLRNTLEAARSAASLPFQTVPASCAAM